MMLLSWPCVGESEMRERATTCYTLHVDNFYPHCHQPACLHEPHPTLPPSVLPLWLLISSRSRRELPHPPASTPCCTTSCLPCIPTFSPHNGDDKQHEQSDHSYKTVGSSPSHHPFTNTRPSTWKTPEPIVSQDQYKSKTPY